MTNPNVDALKQAYALWGETKGGSVDHWLSMMSDDIRFHSLGGGAQPMEFTRDRDCRSEVKGYLEGLMAEWEMVDFTASEFIADGDRVVMVGHVTFRHRKTGKTVESPKADVWRFRDGKAVEFMEFFDTAKAFAGAQP